MNRLIMFMLTLVSPLISKHAIEHFFPNLPVGEYMMHARAIVKCSTTREQDVEFNLYLYKTSSNTSEVRGNITVKKPVDDSYKIHINMAVKDSIGGWKDNAYIIRSPKTCSTVKNLMGSSTLMVTENFGISENCPIIPGVYVSKGFDFTSFVSKSNLPKQLFYGSYKIRVEVLDNKNNQVGCYLIIVDVKRPWETE